MLAVIYLLFNEGYAATSGADLVRRGLCAEAIRLGRTLVALMPDEPEAVGLLALMLLHDARQSGRVDAHGDLVPLEEQDRTQWDTATDRRRRSSCSRPRCAAAGPGRTRCRPRSPRATRPRATPPTPTGTRSPALYGELAKMNGSPVVELNRAVAVAMADGPEAGLAIVDALDASGALAGYHLLPATRADLLRRLGRRDEAAAAYRGRARSATTDAERRYLSRRLDEVTAPLADDVRARSPPRTTRSARR